MYIKDKSKKFYEGIIPELNEAILPYTPIERRKEKNIYKPLFYFATAACLLLGSLFLMNQTRENQLQNKLTNLEKQYAIIENNFQKISGQELNETEIRAISDEKNEKHREILNPSAKKVQKKMETKNMEPDSYKMKTENRRSDYAQYLSSLKTERITKNDFLIPQLIGN
jgi:protein involved in sex pheromone biosynthesis